MYYKLKKKMSGYTHQNLISYLANRCDIITFNIPYFDWKVGEPMPKEFDEDFEEYLDNVEDFLEDVSNYIIKDYMSNKYFTKKTSYMMRIVILPLNEETYDIFVAQNDIFDWKYPADVEDLCFFSRGKCVFYSLAREEVCEIYETSKLEIKFLKKLGLKLEAVDVPTKDIRLKYSLSY